VPKLVPPTAPKLAKAKSRYKLETVSRACEILRQFQDDRQLYSLTELAERTGIETTICFRLLHTLEAEGLLRNTGGHKYASNTRILTGNRLRIGYASQTHDSFSGAIGKGLRWAATEHNVDLVEMDNQYSAKNAMRNAEMLVKQHVDLVIEFQVYDRIGTRLSSIFQEAGIPVIAVEIPIPGAVFFGIDNHAAGVAAGKALVKAAQRHWDGECDELLTLDLEIAGSLPSLRLSGAESVVRKRIGENLHVHHLESRGEFVRSFELTRRYLRFAPKRRTLLTGINDFAVVGALRAFEEAGRNHLCLAVSMGGGPEARQELRLPNTRLTACVGFFPERYGEGILRLALDALQQKSFPGAVYTPIQLFTAQNVDEFYSNDL
jgi:ribose transport system substrate-binding protein